MELPAHGWPSILQASQQFSEVDTVSQITEWRYWHDQGYRNGQLSKPDDQILNPGTWFLHSSYSRHYHWLSLGTLLCFISPPSKGRLAQRGLFYFLHLPFTSLPIMALSPYKLITSNLSSQPMCLSVFTSSLRSFWKQCLPLAFLLFVSGFAFSALAAAFSQVSSYLLYLLLNFHPHCNSSHSQFNS